MKNKRVEIIENPDAGIRCHCGLLDLYNSKLPEEAKEKVLFYVCPKEKVNKPQHVNTLVGITAYQLDAMSSCKWSLKCVD